jgi:hypothetical protein
MTKPIDHTHPHALTPEAVFTGCIIETIEADDGLDQDVLIERVITHHPHVTRGQILNEVESLIDCDYCWRDDSNRIVMVTQSERAIAWGDIDEGDGSS